MQPPIKRYAIMLALGLIVGGLVGEYGHLVLRFVPVVVPQEIKLAAIVHETADGPKMSRGQIETRQLAPDYGVLVIDRDVLDRDRKTPPELAPLIEAAASRDGPVLVILYTSGRTVVHPLPDTPAKLEALLK